MLTSVKAAAVVAALAIAAPADARPVTIEIAMNSYGGQRAYLAAYVVDPSGQYVATVLTAGSRLNYLGHLGRWFRMFQRAGGRVDGTTGASIGSSQSTSATINVPDSMLNSGYSLRVESAVENQRYYPDEAAVPLQNGASVAGAGYVHSVTVRY